MKTETHTLSASHPHIHKHGGRDHDEHTRGLGHLVRGLFAPHSHDAKDSLDQALEGSRDGVRAVAISLVILLLTAGVQAWWLWSAVRLLFLATPSTTERML